eukprot:1146868-Pelagomonas_calceolata.AAC.3
MGVGAAGCVAGALPTPSCCAELLRGPPEVEGPSPAAPPLPPLPEEGPAIEASVAKRVRLTGALPRLPPGAPSPAATAAASLLPAPAVAGGLAGGAPAGAPLAEALPLPEPPKAAEKAAAADVRGDRKEEKPRGACVEVLAGRGSGVVPPEGTRRVGVA